MIKLNNHLKETKKFDLQRRIVSHMTSVSWAEVPHVTYLYEPDITEFYKEFKLLARTKDISFNTIIIKAVVEGVKAAPELNSYIEYNHKKNRGYLHICKDINVSIPWLLSDRRMITPVILNAEKLSLMGISEYVNNIERRIKNTDIDELLYKVVFTDTIEQIKNLNLKVLSRILSAKVGKHRIRALKGDERKSYYSIPDSHRLTEKDILVGTITISNIGSIYKEQKGCFGLLEVIPPQVLAVGISAVQEKPGVYMDKSGVKQIGIRNTLPICMAFDHRAVDFDSLIPLIKRLDEIFSNPKIIHKW